MENLEATQALQQAAHLQGRARSASRWYTRYLVVYGVVSFVFASLFGVVGNRWGAAVLTPLWAVFVALLSAWSFRKKTAILGFGRLHGIVIGAWAVLWGITVLVGSNRYQGQLGWWVAGGAAMALPCFVGAVVAHRRTAVE